MTKLVPVEIIAGKIIEIRGKKVMLDKDIASLYEVTTFNLNKAVKRNLERFPSDFMFQLNPEESKALIFQTGISKKGRGGTRYCPYAFTEQGVAMLSSVLRSRRAVLVNIQIMRAFVKLKELFLTHRELALRLEKLERQFGEHDNRIKIIFEAMRQLLEPPKDDETKPKPRIGFHRNGKEG
jgi:hypothetical protein